MADTITIDESKRFTAYNTKTKQKGVPIYNAEVHKIVQGNKKSYIVKGTTQDGAQKLSAVTSLEKAEAGINAGVAARGTGWD